jgi:predicted transcriptional regulator
MSTSRITISISSELNEALRRIAVETNESVSSIAAEALAQRVRDAAIDDFLVHAKEKFGEIPQEALDSADRLLAKTAARGRRVGVRKAAA